MDRRDFLQKGAAALLATQLGGTTLLASCSGEGGSSMSNQNPNQGGTNAVPGALKVRFLGTGAADWTTESYRGEHRNLSSILVDNHILIDYTKTAASMIPAGVNPTAVFYTHSHGDHFNADDAMQLGIKTVYVSISWYDTAVSKFKTAAAAVGKAAPQVIGMKMLTPYVLDGITFTALPANHATSVAGEQTVIYLMEKNDARVLYATDTGGIPAVGAQYAGFDKHVSNPKALTGLIMEATMGTDYDDDFRIFTHSSVGTVHRTALALKKTNLYQPKNNMPVYLTHMARTLHPTQAELDRTLPSILAAAYDGLEIEF